jgi:23S rRNA pseudouridine2457 synthase
MPTYILYKPFGMLSQFTKEAEHHITLQEVEFIFPKEVYPVGRLDADSEGLLLLTDDKKLNAALLHPKNKQPKTYWGASRRRSRKVSFIATYQRSRNCNQR